MDNARLTLIMPKAIYYNQSNSCKNLKDNERTNKNWPYSKDNSIRA